MEDQMIITGITAGKLEDLVSGAVLTGLRVFQQRGEKLAQGQPEEEQVLTREQAAHLLGVTLPTLREWTKKGVVPGYRLESRVFYKRSEVLASLQRIRTAKTARP